MGTTAINDAQGAMQNLPVGTVNILKGRDMPLKPCPDPAVMNKALRSKFEEVARLADEEARLREQAWANEEGIPSVIAQEADDAAEAARSGAPIEPSKVPAIRDEVERLRAQGQAFATAKKVALAEALEAGSAEFESAFNKAD